MKIVILGAAGFIGTNLAISLSKNKENFITLVDQNVERLRKIYELKRDDIRIIEINLIETNNLRSVLEGQDIVYHLISTTVPATSNQCISQEINDNVGLTSKILDECVKCGVRRIIYFSSGGTVYGINAKCPLAESMSTNPISSYGVQKVMNEKLLYLYNYIYGLDYRIIRLANPYGPYQRPNGIQGAVTTFTYKALKNEKINIYGDGSVVRDYIYIDDAIEAILNIANSDKAEKIYNVGNGIGISLNELLNKIEIILDVKIKREYMPERLVDIPVNYLDISRYEKDFGKLKHTSLTDGIRKTAEFMLRE